MRRCTFMSRAFDILVWPVITAAQAVGKVRRIGYLGTMRSCSRCFCAQTR